MTGEARHHEPNQRRAPARSHAGDRILNQCRGREGVGAVAIEQAQSAEALQIVRNVAARSLLLRADRDPVAVVFYEEQERQAFRGDDVERRPKSVRGRRGLTAVRDGDAVLAGLLAELRLAIAQRLRPAYRRSVLGADAAAHRQHAGTRLARHVEYHTDIPPVAHAAGTHHGR